MDVLATHRNQSRSLEQSLGSLSSQLPADAQIHVVDAGSTDGAYTTLERLDAAGEIRLELATDASRGRGRQLALERSSADVVAAHLDLDVLYRDVLSDLESVYHRVRAERGDGLLLFHGGLISSAEVLRDAGGWRDLQVHEDKDLWLRASERTTLYYLPVSAVRRHANHDWQSRRYRLRRVYYNLRDALRLGVPGDRLAAALRIHRPLTSRPLDRLLLRAARRGARAKGGFDVVDGDRLDPGSHRLWEFTFPMLRAHGLLDPVVLDPPPSLASHVVDAAYPGETSYSSGEP